MRSLITCKKSSLRFAFRRESSGGRRGLNDNRPIKPLSFMASSPIRPFDFSKHSTPDLSARPLTPAPSLREYIRGAWPVIEPATPFIGGFHVDAIADHLEAITRGELRNLIINIPPRHSKSSLVSVLWPTWEWIDAPWLRWLFVSYAQPLSTRDSVKRRRLIESDWYRARWGDRFRLTDDQNQKIRFENDRTGLMIATSVGGVGTGEGGTRRVIDDPHSAEDVESDTKRQNTLDWWDGTMATRADQPGTSATVIVMQRLHERDLTGHVLELAKAGGEAYEHLVLPAEYEPRVTVCLAQSERPLTHDDRTEEGQLLSPERFDRPALERLKVTLGDRTAGQLQQRPAPAGGAVYRREWYAEGLNRYRVAVHLSTPTQTVGRWISLDTAMKDGEANDYTGAAIFDLRADYRLRLREVWNERLQFHDLLAMIRDEARRWDYDGKLSGVIIEDKNSGTSAGQTLSAAADDRLSGLIEMFMPSGSKVYRARQAAQWCALSCVELPEPSAEAPWLTAFAGPEPGGKLFKFPTVEHDDDIDAFSQGIIFLEPFLAEGYRARGGAAA